MCGKEKDTERKRGGKWHERSGESAKMKHENHNQPASERWQTKHILSQNKTLSVSLVHPLHQMLTFSSPPVQEAWHHVWQGGSWGLKFSQCMSKAPFDGKNVAFCCCSLPASLKHISVLPSAHCLLDQSSFLLLRRSSFPHSIDSHTQKKHNLN